MPYIDILYYCMSPPSSLPPHKPPTVKSARNPQTAANRHESPCFSGKRGCEVSVLCNCRVYSEQSQGVSHFVLVGHASGPDLVFAMNQKAASADFVKEVSKSTQQASEFILFCCESGKTGRGTLPGERLFPLVRHKPTRKAAPNSNRPGSAIRVMLTIAPLGLRAYEEHPRFLGRARPVSASRARTPGVGRQGNRGGRCPRNARVVSHADPRQDLSGVG